MPRSDRFRDLVSGQPSLYDTRVVVLWDKNYLYIGYWVENLLVEAHLNERDTLIYQDNDIELFIAWINTY